MALLDIFAREQRELSKSEVARLLDLPESSSSDLLNTLHDVGYLNRTVTTRRFYPSSRLFAVATAIAANDPLGAFGAEAASLLAQRSGESSCCATAVGRNLRIINVAQGSHRLRYVLEVGDTFTLNATAIGKALLGAMDDDEVARLIRLDPLPKRTPKTITDPRKLENEIRRHRERGWFQSFGEGTEGVSSIAVAGRVGGEVVGLGLVGPADRVAANIESLSEILLEVRDTVFGDS